MSPLLPHVCIDGMYIPTTICYLPGRGLQHRIQHDEWRIIARHRDDQCSREYSSWNLEVVRIQHEPTVELYCVSTDGVIYRQDGTVLGVLHPV